MGEESREIEGEHAEGIHGVAGIFKDPFLDKGFVVVFVEVVDPHGAAEGEVFGDRVKEVGA